MKKQCPLCSNVCDFPDLLEEFPLEMRNACAEEEKCLLRSVSVFGTDNGNGEPMNLVQARLFNLRFGYQEGRRISSSQLCESVRRFIDQWGAV